MRAKDLRGFGPVGTNGPAPLSTPAAGQDDDPMRLVRGQARAWEAVVEALDRAVPDWNRADGTCSMDRACKVIQQLQARNAEQAAAYARMDAAYLAEYSAHADTTDRLTALLDGIEGSPSGVVKEVGGSLVMIGELSEPYRASAGRVYIISADDLQRLRESSVPAIGEKVDG